MKFNLQKTLVSAQRESKKGNLIEARKLYHSILKVYPKNNQAHKSLKALDEYKHNSVAQPEISREQIELVFSLYSNGQIENAIEKIKALNEIYPNVPLLFNLLGACYKSLGQLDGAIQMFETAIKIKPDYAEAYFNHGVILKDQGKLSEAIESYRQAIKILPNYPDAHNNLGNIFSEVGQRNSAIESYEWAIAYKSNFAEAHFHLAILYGEFDENKAIIHYNKAIEINPNYFEAYFSLGLSFIHLGLKNKAIQNFEKVLTINPDYIEAHKALSLIKQYENNDPQVDKMQSLLSTKNLNNEEVISLNFALAKVNSDLKNQNEYFNFLHEANSLAKKEINYSIGLDIDHFRSIREVFKPPHFQVNKFSKDSLTFKPIFIVGMPRSGTSLVEQIISSHHQVYGAGELDIFWKLCNPLFREFKSNGKKAFSKKNLLSIRQKYLNYLSSLNTEEKIITDKMPLNFRYIGFIFSVFPEAKVINLNRDARAVCWSIYKYQFKTKGNGYAYNLKDLADYYGLYSDLMNFWRDLYRDKIYDICYEDLTSSQEVETRKLLEYCQLDWDKNCLKFENNNRAVTTASALQIRQKMYQGSSEAWKEHEDFLNPLITGLSSY